MGCIVVHSPYSDIGVHGANAICGLTCRSREIYCRSAKGNGNLRLAPTAGFQRSKLEGALRAIQVSQFPYPNARYRPGAVWYVINFQGRMITMRNYPSSG